MIKNNSIKYKKILSFLYWPVNIYSIASCNEVVTITTLA